MTTHVQLATPTPDHSSSDISVAVPRSTLEVLQYYFSGSLYWIGGWCFLAGSILYYPRYYTLYDIEGEGALIGAWLFVVGCFTFLIGSCWDAYCAKGCEGTSSLRFFPLICSLWNVVGSVQFVIGGFYFVPVVYATAPSAGCLLFITGCSCFEIALLIDIARMFQVGSIRGQAWWYIAAVFNILGNILFIVGSYYFLPKFLTATDDSEEALAIATDNSVFAINNFVVGSIAFVLAPTAQLIALYLEPAVVPESADKVIV
ncbi:hypothetical protein SDRG_01474 [Saprolegnia diclina VS20]|uniref:YrhK domain-containing protein n=1 Tax=Saprolegnia diclina (strain VS20) TaxID=1156394 RepID=T0SF50_SAPDV|nr:hypothetical protein SDRG_01474 [Saprolegnia diclina VS20]EQC41507.1 hypothetical protein SDRG_01474 [Saprolegnia diclina VS20]|eukprot:XP_008605221.1 hypothetical protein SDRG_01474 [Saprolegnia diclina VS20]